MTQSIEGFFDSETFMPYGHCFLWQPEILWLHTLSDAGIVFAYLLIPFVLLYLLHKRKDLPFESIFLLFAAFILLCGATHAMNIWVIWNPDYAIAGMLKAATALTSVLTLFIIIKLVPRILAIPSNNQITEINKQLQEAKQELQLQLERNKTNSDSYLSAVFNTVIDGLITIDQKGTIQRFNLSAEKIFGYSAAEVMGRNVNILMPEPYYSGHDGYLSHYLTTGEKKVIGIGRVVSGRRKNGNVFPMELGINEMSLDGARMFVGTVRDISERKKLEIERETFIEKLTQSNSELERFAYICSHDLQEPLRMISNFSQRLEKHLGAALDEKGRHYMQYVTDGATQARQLISDVLNYARIDHEPEHLDNIESEKILAGVLRDLNERIEETNALITHDALPEVYMQPVHLRQLLQNLIGNALKFCTETPHIHIGVEQEGLMWRFYVRDNGIGIPQEHMHKIFSIFQRLHSRDRYPGTGIGLALCKKVVQKYSGRIWVESEPGKGSVFYFTLPPAVTHER